MLSRKGQAARGYVPPPRLPIPMRALGTARPLLFGETVEKAGHPLLQLVPLVASVVDETGG